MARQGRTAALRAGQLLLSVAAAITAAAALCGCADISQKFAATASEMPYIGLPEGAPARPAGEAPYPAVHDMPAARNSVTLTNFEQKKLEDDLAAARDEQQSKAGMKNAVASQKGKPQKGKKAEPAPATVVPVTSRASIY
jgi:hypothetical protein